MSKQNLLKLIESLPEGALATLEAEAKKLVLADPIIKYSFGPSFKFDFTKNGYDLESGPGHNMIGDLEFDLATIVQEGVNPISSDKMLLRAKELGSNLTQLDGEELIAKDKIPAKLRPYYIPLTGTGWVHRDSRERYVPCLDWGGRCWFVRLSSLDSGFGAFVRLLVPRKK